MEDFESEFILRRIKQVSTLVGPQRSLGSLIPQQSFGHSVLPLVGMWSTVNRLFRVWKKHGALALIVASLLVLFFLFLNRKREKGFSSAPTGRFFKGEHGCRKTLEAIFDQPFPTTRPDFLRNPRTGRNLECDMYNRDLQLCVEYHGKQHYEYVPRFHRDQEAFKQQTERDQLKIDLLKKAGVHLVVVPYNADVTEHLLRELSKYREYQPYVENFKKRHELRKLGLELLDKYSKP